MYLPVTMSFRVLPRAAALAVLFGLSACSDFQPTSAPRLRIGSADQVGPRLTTYGAAVLPADGSISVWGDDFTSSAPGAPYRTGKGRTGKGKTPSLAADLARATGLKVVDHSSPGQTVADGLAQLQAGEAGSLVVLCYGYGDAAIVVDYPGDDLAPPPDIGAPFRTSLAAMIKLAHSRGAPVLLVTEPLPVLTPSLTPTDAETLQKRFVAKMQILQGAVHAVAVAEGAGVIDSPSVLSVNTLTPTEKQPGAALSTTRIAHMIAADIELAR